MMNPELYKKPYEKLIVCMKKLRGEGTCISHGKQGEIYGRPY